MEFSSPSPLTRKFRNSEEETLSAMSHADDLVAHFPSWLDFLKVISYAKQSSQQVMLK